MSAAERRAVLQHSLNVADVFVQNAALRNAIPDKPPRPVVAEEPPAAPPELRVVFTGDPIATATATATPAAGGPVPGQIELVSEPAAKRSWLRDGLLLGAAGLGSSGIVAGAITLAAHLFGGDDTPAPSTTIVQQADQSLLQYLQEGGYHLAPEKRP
jgi:hypothetical protein